MDPNNKQIMENHFSDYIKEVEDRNLHPKLKTTFQSMKSKPDCNIIFYGPPGVGKYTQALSVIKKFSPKKLNYERKMLVPFNKADHYFKISDVHFEIDMETLGCNAKLLWNEIFVHIIDVISSRQSEYCIILCKNFHKIHSELLEIFYSYMQRSKKNIPIYYYIISENISFLPCNIVSSCIKISIPRPSINQYNKVISKNINKKNIAYITNLKEIKINKTIINKNQSICEQIYNQIMNPQTLIYTHFRDILYDILIYDYNVYYIVYELLEMFYENNIINKEKMGEAINKSYKFLRNYNNNYRPIYHLENYLYNLINKIHGL